MRKNILKNSNGGFSLVELITVMAIVAILSAALVPSMLHWVERSRAQKDDSVMAEMTNAVMLALSADQDIYDEVLYYSTFGNFSCYVDKAHADQLGEKIITREAKNGQKEQFLYGDDDRLLDEEVWYIAGNMRGTTITFQPGMREDKQEFYLADAVINKYIQDITPDGMNTSLPIEGREGFSDELSYVNDVPDYSKHGTLGTMSTGTGSTAHLFNRLKSAFGENILLTSQTYRNSEYTVFIRLGTTGAYAEDEQRAVVVYGQWNGTNLFAYDMQAAQQD